MGNKGLVELERTYGRWIHGINNLGKNDYDSLWPQICHEVDQSV